MNRIFKYRLYPTNIQQESLSKVLGAARFVYNQGLQQRKEHYETTGESLNFEHQCKTFRDLRKEFEWLQVLGSHPTQQILRRLNCTFQSFFRRLKKGKGKPGYPRFKGANRFHSVPFTHGFGTVFHEDQRKLYIQNVGQVKVKQHRLLPKVSCIKQVIVKRFLGKWFCCLQLEIPDPDIQLRPDNPVGIDMGIHWLLALSDHILRNPRWYRESEAKLRRAQRALSRCKNGSNRRKKARRRVAKVHEKISNQRRDFWHKVTRELVDTYTFIALEDLSLNFMIKNRRLAKSALDAGLGMFQEFLGYKAAEAGTQEAFVDPKGTSIDCSGCGRPVKKKLSTRVHSCSCGLIIDRDENAALNILYRARTGPSGANVDRWVERSPKSLQL